MQYSMQDQSPICPPHFDRQCCVVNHLKDTTNATLWIKIKRDMAKCRNFGLNSLARSLQEGRNAELKLLQLQV